MESLIAKHTILANPALENNMFEKWRPPDTM
jgi:hypothetical protein